jgi:DNA mismatch repair protein MutS
VLEDPILGVLPLPIELASLAGAILGALEGGAASPAGGKPVRGKRAPQLDLFGAGGADESLPPQASPALDMLRALDLDRMTPLEALTTLAKLKGLAEPT